jgi:hypothetical protein
MISDPTLQRAVAEGVITSDQADRLRALAGEAADSVPEDPEKLRFVSGFGDIFVALGIGLFLLPAGYLADAAWGRFGGAATVAILAWLLSEFFTRKRRLALPSILLLVSFVLSDFVALMTLFGAEVGSGSWLNWGDLNHDGRAATFAALGAAALACAHYLRFRVPITIAAGAAAIGLAIVAGAFTMSSGLSASTYYDMVLAYGVLVFLVAMRFDMSDRERQTRRTDIAFWLHLLAAPLIVHSLIRGFLGGLNGPPDSSAAAGVLIVFLVLGLIAVAIDRRALLVSGLLYAGIAFGALVGRLGFVDRLVPATVLALGAFVLALSAGWRPLRRLVLGLLPPALARRLPHPLAASS